MWHTVDADSCSLVVASLGFEAVAFSYPQRARLGSSSLAWSETSQLVNFTDEELASAFTGADTLRTAFPWRCDAWHKPMCSVWDFDKTPLIRDGCTACIGNCYRDSSVMLHFAVSLCDALTERGKENSLQH